MLNRGTREGIESEWDDSFIVAMQKLDAELAKEPKIWQYIIAYRKQGYTPSDAAVKYIEYLTEQRKIYPDKVMRNEAFKCNGWYRWYPTIGYHFAGRWANESPKETA